MTDGHKNFQDTHKYAIADRFLKLFEGLGAKKNDIPKILGDDFDITYSDLYESKDLLMKLSPRLLEWCSNVFGVNEDWLTNGNGTIYPSDRLYSVPSFVLGLKKTNKCYGDSFKIWVISDTRSLDPDDTSCEQNLLFLLSIPSGVNSLKRYIPISGGKWNNEKNRFEIKSVFWLCKRLSINLNGMFVTKDQFSNLENGNAFPDKLLGNMRLDWEPEYYCSDDTTISKEIKEWKSVFSHIKTKKYDCYVDSICSSSISIEVLKISDKVFEALEYIQSFGYPKLKIHHYENAHTEFIKNKEEFLWMFTSSQENGFRRISSPTQLGAILNFVKESSKDKQGVVNHGLA